LRLGWPLWWFALAGSVLFLFAPSYVLRIYPQARTTLLVAFGCILLIGTVALFLGIARTWSRGKLKAALLGLAAVVPQIALIVVFVQLAGFRSDGNLGVVCKDGNCISIVEAAERGNPEAQFRLGMAHATGRGRPRDDAAAVEWFARAARGGHARGQAYYGMSLYRGIGASPDRAEAVKWLAKAAEAGEREAQSALGIAYYEGGGVEVNYLEAEKWWRRAALQGAIDAQFNIGALYFEGRGVAKNEDEALKWLVSAAEHGHPGAAGLIGKLGFHWPEDKPKISERLASSTTLITAQEAPNPKMLAWRAEQRAKAEALMAKDVNAFDEAGQSALYYAVGANDLALVRALLDKGADPNGRRSEDLWAPLHAAASGGSAEIARLLIDRGATVGLASKDVPTPIEIAVGSDNNAVVTHLLARGADVHSVSENGGGTLLHSAATHSDNRELVELLLHHGADPNARDRALRTSLHFAASTSELRRIPVPLGKSPSPPFGRKLEVVHALIKGGADPNLRDASGRTAADHAKEGADGKGVPREARARFEEIIAALRAGAGKN
jgi:ankyrin repeat protein